MLNPTKGSPFLPFFKQPREPPLNIHMEDVWFPGTMNFLGSIGFSQGPPLRALYSGLLPIRSSFQIFSRGSLVSSPFRKSCILEHDQGPFAFGRPKFELHVNLPSPLVEGLQTLAFKEKTARRSLVNAEFNHLQTVLSPEQVVGRLVGRSSSAKKQLAPRFSHNQKPCRAV